MIDIFIAYSHEDLAYKNELKKFLRPLVREERVSIWDDYEIEAGQEWDVKIKERLSSADIILLLVSSDSLASDYFYGEEVKSSLERHHKREAVVIPVILRHCDWENTPLGGLEALPEKGRAIVEWPTRDQAWQDTVSRLRKVVETVEHKQKIAEAYAEQQGRFNAVIETATHFINNDQWLDAHRAYEQAFVLFQPGFFPDILYIQQQIELCSKQIKIEVDSKIQLNEREKPLISELAQEPNDDTRKVLQIILGVFGGIIILLGIWLGLDFFEQKQPSPIPPKPIPVIPNQDSIAYFNALQFTSPLALAAYLKNYPNGKYRASAKHICDSLYLNYEQLRTQGSGLVEKGKEQSKKISDLIQSLDKTKKTLDEESAAKEALKFEKISLENEKLQLAKKANIASAIRVKDVTTKEIRKRTNETGGVKSKIDTLQICFQTESNEVANAGEETFYLRIVDPTGAPLAVDNLGSSVAQDKRNESDFRYTTTATCNYQNIETHVCVKWHLPLNYPKGKYKIEVYNKGYFVGTGTFNLK
jgi:hypothetical protein